MLGQIKVTYYNRKEESINKVVKMHAVGSDNAEMADKVIHESMYSITSRLRSGI